MDHIGGPYFAFKPFMEACKSFYIHDNRIVAQYDSTGPCGESLQAALNYGLQISVGFQIDISYFNMQIFQHTFNATTIYSGYLYF